MTNFEKLEKAHEIAFESEKYWFKAIFGNTHHAEIELYDEKGKLIDGINCLDSLVSFLEYEKKKPHNKYQKGETVWRLNDEYEPCCFSVFELDTESGYGGILYQDSDGGWWPEELVYASKKDLIEEQLNHWATLMSDFIHDEAIIVRTPKPEINRNQFEPDIDRCQHESNDNLYQVEYPYIDIDKGGWVNPAPKMKCIKCGEFYR